MSIRIKIVLVVLPLMIAALLVSGAISSFSARSGITRVAMRFLSFKGQELEKYIGSQWELLVSNDLAQREEYRQVTVLAIQSYAGTLLSTPSELIFALTEDGGVAMSTAEVTDTTLEPGSPDGWAQLSVNGEERVGHVFEFAPLGWTVIVSDGVESFFQEVNELTYRNVISTSIAAVVVAVLLLVFTGYLTRPIIRVADVMNQIIEENDLSKRAEVEYADEVGRLAHTFNRMTGALDQAYRQIKQFAFRAVLAQKNERKIRNIFQKYVPKDVIDTFFRNPESMLVGQNRELAILFSDIRSFTTISEGFEPDELVTSLNRYFSAMVEIIMDNGGIVDKYIGDAIMALFGAPVVHENDAYRAVLAALDMHEALLQFNKEQIDQMRPEFRTGIGISFGSVTVGNIGSEKKMDYTVIGDMVNLASRLEGLTKIYHQNVIFSSSVYSQIKGVLPCRLVDKVVVKGKTRGENIYTAVKELDEETQSAWEAYHEGLDFYYERKFEVAVERFVAAQRMLGGDRPSELFLARAKRYIAEPPPADWHGVEVLTEK